MVTTQLSNMNRRTIRRGLLLALWLVVAPGCAGMPNTEPRTTWPDVSGGRRSPGRDTLDDIRSRPRRSHRAASARARPSRCAARMRERSMTRCPARMP